MVTALHNGNSIVFDGVWGSTRALLLAELANQSNGLFVILPRQADMDSLLDDLEVFSERPCEVFPAWEVMSSDRRMDDIAFGDRLRLLKQLLGGQVPGLCLTSIEAVCQPVPDSATIREATRRFAVGETIDVDGLGQWLVEHDFHRTTAVELPGEFSMRGGILDIYAPDWFQPARIELFDDLVESIRTFDVKSQRSLEGRDSIEVTVLPPTVGTASVLDFLPAATWPVLIEPERVVQSGRVYLERFKDDKTLASVEDVQKQLGQLPLINTYEVFTGSAEHECHLGIESIAAFQGDLDQIRNRLDEVAGGDEVHVVCPTEGEVERVADIFKSTKTMAGGRLFFSLGNLSVGMHVANEQTIVVGTGDLFHRGELRRPRRRRLGKAIDSFLDLKTGDLVVHLAHGIGRYLGLRKIEKDGHAEEYLELEFDGGTKIFVPAAKIDLVQKYIGGSKTRPTLAKIGGKTWMRQKQAAESAVMDLASDMLQIQAERMSKPGIAFQPDSEWQREFDHAFPYTETPDQKLSIDTVKLDMEAERPMDRLLCGDVGFGKTEVAMRAAFKAVESGYQVAVLVPTTILAEQHHSSFMDRMSEFPVDVGKLSRFASPAEQRATIDGLKAGRVDIVVGTHRLASKDVDFYNLGLIVIDEEQRFGVEVKERLKSIRAEVDVLTMSATPIPRTLHMSLVGVRDISNLETAPEERVSVETRVTRFNDELVRNAILRELNRDGQAYFVHNRVHDIQVVADKLRYIVPEARIGIAHGQMHERELEKNMLKFMSHEYDVLVATTIVESGLDIPNANTIFIDEADRYGLADLHQLRGRVGRYKHQAYCYLLLTPTRMVTPDAAKRLRAIEEYSHMGAGFAIAMRDLEIRGAGNLLGTQQSGHIATVGYELYCQLLENAVRQLKNMPATIRLDVDINLPGQAFLPDDYVSDMRSKVDIYRRLTRISAYEELALIRDELKDRFGPIPTPVAELVVLAELKLDAAVWQLESIFLETEYMVFRGKDKLALEQLAKRHAYLRLVDDRTLYLPLAKIADDRSLYDTAKSILSMGD